VQPVGVGAQADHRDFLAIARPLPAARPAGAQAAFAMRRFTSSERQDSTVSRPDPLGRPDPMPPTMCSRFSRNRLESSRAP
jgi:hypothetical protein